MKSIIKIFSLSLLFTVAISIISSNKSVAQTVTLQVFYDQLSPYGTWVHHNTYGYVFVPKVEAGFTPYNTGGHWVLTEDGWTWVSDYKWGWAAFHYGRWHADAVHGWLWIPDTHWGPAWVAWRRSDSYYGWAPLEPGIRIRTGFRTPVIPEDRWVFVKHSDFIRPDVNHYYVNRTENVTIIKNTTVINNTYIDKGRKTTYVTGPSRDDVQKTIGKEVTKVSIKESTKPGQDLKNNELEIYKPKVEKSTANTKKPAPAKVGNIEDEKHPLNLQEQTTTNKKGSKKTDSKKSTTKNKDNKKKQQPQSETADQQKPPQNK